MLRHLKKAEAAVESLRHPDDAEALHDLRVALRHLRTYLASYRKRFKDAVPDKSLEALRELTQLTGPARDAEVQAEWISKQPQGRRATSGAVAHLLSRLNERHAELLREIHERFTQDFPRLATRLRRQLQHAEDKGRRTFGRYTAKQVLRQGQRLRERLDRLVGPADVEGCHKARIAAKRVRYLLEPFEALPEVAPLLERLKQLQDTLGQVHDLHVLMETMAGDQASELASLAVRALQRLTRLYAEVERDWLGEAGAGLDESLATVASTLREAGRPGQ
jgi:CHAD domain-containing protein